MKSSYRTFNTDSPYFITSTIVEWIPIFKKEAYSDILFQNFVFYQEQYKMDIMAYVIMPEHFHMICRCKQIEKAVQSLKSYTAKELLTKLRSDGSDQILWKLEESKAKHKTQSKYQVWQEGYMPKEMFDSKIMRQKTEYIHYNPVKKGYVENPEDWKYSSAGFYMTGLQSKLVITPYS